MPRPAFHGTYYIGHSGEYFPYCYRNRFTNKLEGIYLFVWQLIADQTGATFTPKFVNYDSAESVANLTFDGLQGEVLRGRLLTAFEGTNMVPGMPFLYRYSMPFFESSVSLYETRRTTPSGLAASYIVYPQDLLILFLAILLFSSVIDSARHVVSKMMGKPYTDNSLQHTFLLPSIVVVLAIHNAGYSGNSLSHPPVKTTYDGLMRGMQSGSRQFVIEAKYLITYKSDFDHFMTASSRPFFVAQSIFERFEKLCSDPSLVSAIFTLDLATVSAIKGVCTLVRIPTPGYTAGIHNFDDSRYYGMVFGKNFSTNAMVEKTNQVLLRYFREEQMFNIWIPRFARTYVGNIWGDTNLAKKHIQYSPFRYENLNSLLTIIYSFYGASILIFLLEFIVLRNFLFTCALLSSFTVFLLYLSASGRESQHEAITASLVDQSHQEKTYTKTRVFPQGGDGISNDVPWPIAPKNIVNDSNYFIEEGRQLKFIVGDFSYSNGLGNLMFQYASLRSIARKEGARVVLPEDCVLRRAFDLDAVFVNADVLMQLMIDYSDQTVEVKDCCRFQPLENLFNDGNNVVIISGYLQSYRYFDKPNDFHLLMAQFSFLSAIEQEAHQMFTNFNVKRMISQAKPIEGRDGENSLIVEDGQSEVFWVGVHVRHGMDITMHSRNLKYGHTAAPLEYFEKAMQEMRERHENVAFLICSDDIDWAARNFKETTKGEFAFCQRGAPREIDIQLLASCDGLILSPGTFSWWAGWLSHSVEVLYYSGWPRVGTSLDRQLNKTEYYIDEWKAINV